MPCCRKKRHLEDNRYTASPKQTSSRLFSTYKKHKEANRDSTRFTVSWQKMKRHCWREWGIRRYLPIPKKTWKPPSCTAGKKKVRGIHENLTDPNTSIQEGAWQYLVKMLFWEQWGKSKILGPSPVLWLFRVPLVMSWLLLFKRSSYDVTTGTTFQMVHHIQSAEHMEYG